MKLYLIRHGIAQEKRADISDEERSLTKAGRHKTELVARRLKNLGLQFDLIATSPLVRAKQTAEILIAARLSSQLEECSHLAFDGRIEDWLREWLPPRYSPDAVIALVGHEPCLSSWASRMVWGEAKESLVLKKAGMIGIEVPDEGSPLGRCQMYWLTPPRYLL